jgi:hypothetical protein
MSAPPPSFTATDIGSIVDIPECFQTEYCLKNVAYWGSGYQFVVRVFSSEDFETMFEAESVQMSQTV